MRRLHAEQIAAQAQDSKRLDKFQEMAERWCYGWGLDARMPTLKHFSQEPQFKTIREAIDAMPDPPEKA